MEGKGGERMMGVYRRNWGDRRIGEDGIEARKKEEVGEVESER